MTAIEDVIRAAASVGRDAAEGKLAPAALDAAVADECRDLFGTVVGPADPLWPVQLDVTRQVLALGGVSVNELGEWLAVARSREPAAPGGTDGPPETAPSVSGAHSPLDGGVETAPKTRTNE